MACSPHGLKVYRLVLATIGLLVGVSVFPVFGFVYHNWMCAGWGLTSGVFAAILIYVHVSYNNDTWRRHPQYLRPLMFLGCFGQTVAVAGFIVNVVLGAINHQGLVLEGAGYYLGCVWCFMTWKWSFLLFYYSRDYRKNIETVIGVNPDIGYEKI